MPLAAAVCAAVGLAIGPLVGIIVDRAVERESFELLLRCPRCGESLGSRSLIPLIGLSSQCSSEHRSWRYPLTTAATAAGFAIAGFRFGFTWQLWPYLALIVLLVAMAVIDLETKLLLNVLTYPTAIGFLFAVLVLSTPNNYADGIAPALWAGGLYLAFFMVVHLAYPAGMGLGDVKLAPTLGLAVGWLFTDPIVAIQHMLVALVLGLLLGGITGVVVQRSRKAEVPFGPFMVLGTMIVIAGTVPASV